MEYWRNTIDKYLPNEEWRDVPGYVGYYQVSNFSRIRSLDMLVNHNCGGTALRKGRILTQQKTHHPYLRVTFSINGKRSDFFAHIIVGLVWVANPSSKPKINHKNGIKLDNLPSNLEWCTDSENIQHAYDTGLFPKRFGANNHFTKLTEQQAREIKLMIRDTSMTVKTIAEAFNVSRGAIYGIKKGFNWSHLKI